MRRILDRVQGFSLRFGLSTPILLAPMAGACPPGLSASVISGGGMGACGVLLMEPEGILEWAAAVRAATQGPFQLNNWIPDPEPRRDRRHEERLAKFLGGWGPEVDIENLSVGTLDFESQFDAMVEAKPAAISSIMGLLPNRHVDRLRAAGILWFATVSTVAEARAAEAAGADVIVAQGAEAGGHRGAFDPARAEKDLVGLFALVPAIVDAVDLPVVASGGIADARTCVAALMLGASAVQIGTGFLRCPEADIAPAWAQALASAQPEDTVVSPVFSGRPGRSLATDYVRAATARGAPRPAPYPVQRALTAAMRKHGADRDDIRAIQAWAGQSARLARAQPASEIVRDIWRDSLELLTG